MGTPHKHAEVIKAWAEGEPIQIWESVRGQWIDWPDNLAPSWFESRQYRVKPKEPRRFWINVYAEGPAVLHTSLESAVRGRLGWQETIEVMEVIK